MEKRISILLVILTFVLIVDSALAQEFKPGTEPDGFRDIKWLTNISTLPDMKHIRSEEPLEVYTRKGDDLTIAKARLEKIEYKFGKQNLDT